MSASRIEPPANGNENVSFWNSTREKRLTYQRCLDCGRPVWYPREVCPGCLGTNLEWRDSAGRGEIYAASVHHLPANPTMETPYVVALVALDEGVRMMTNIVNWADPYDAAVGRRVRVAWEPLSDGRNLPVFELEEA